MSQGEQDICELQRFDPLLERMPTVAHAPALLPTGLETDAI